MHEAKVIQQGRLDNVTVTTADGRVFNLGRPGTIRHRIRLARYLKKRGMNNG